MGPILKTNFDKQSLANCEFQANVSREFKDIVIILASPLSKRLDSERFGEMLTSSNMNLHLYVKFDNIVLYFVRRKRTDVLKITLFEYCLRCRARKTLKLVF